MLDLAILEQFAAYAHAGTLAKAAEQLHISQPTLTRSMQKLETEFGVSLFSRTKNRIELTEAGRLAARNAEMILRQYETMLYSVREHDCRSRTIHVGSCAPVPVTGVVQALTEHFPGAVVSSELKSVPELTTGLAEDRYQLVILPKLPETGGLHAVPLCKEQILFFLHKSHPLAGRESLAAAELNGEAILLFQDIGFWHDLVTQKLPDSPLLMQSKRYDLVALAENSTMPLFVSDAKEYRYDAEDRVRVPIRDPEFTVTYHLVCRAESKQRFRELFDNLRSSGLA